MCLGGWKQWFNIQSTTHSKVNEHLEELNVFRFPPLVKKSTYAEAFGVPSERVRGQRLRIHADGNINTLEVSCGLHIPQTSYEIVKSKLLVCVCVCLQQDECYGRWKIKYMDVFQKYAQ